MGPSEMKNKLRAALHALRHLGCQHRWKEVWWSPYMADYGFTKTWVYVCVKCQKSVSSRAPWFGIEHLQRRSH